MKVKIYDRYLVGLGPREVSVVRLEEGETSVTEVTLNPLHRAIMPETPFSKIFLRSGGDNLLQIPFLQLT